MGKRICLRHPAVIKSSSPLSLTIKASKLIPPLITIILSSPFMSTVISQDNMPINTNTQTECPPTGSTMLPLSGCIGYVTCSNGVAVSTQKCSSGLLFDEIIRGCNFDYLVECLTTTTTSTVISVDTNTNNNDTNIDNNTIDTQTVCPPNDHAIFPLPGCTGYVSCSYGIPITTQPCPPGLLYDESIQGCNWDYLVDCATTNEPTRRPTERPTMEPTKEPITGPSLAPTVRPTPRPTQQPTSRPTRLKINTNAPITEQPTVSFPNILELIQDRIDPLERTVFLSHPIDGPSYRSYWFRHADFHHALSIASTGMTDDSNHRFYLGEQHEWEYGLINVALFLGQAMTEGIAGDACDEHSWESDTDPSDAPAVKGGMRYAISNSCGQGGMNYQEFHCGPEESHMECTVDVNTVLQATTGGVDPSAPPPLACRPRTTEDSFTGFWNVGLGREMDAFPYENSFGRTDVEGCCFWGRGAIHTRGLCNLGKLNYHLGKRAADDGRTSRYPNVDFCSFPEAICAGNDSPELRWIAGMFEWADRVQTYDDGKGWNYMIQLKKFVDDGMYDEEFVRGVSGVLTQGCHHPPCEGGDNGGLGAGTVLLEEERVKNFQIAMVALEAGGEKTMIRAITNYFSERKDVVNSRILQSQTPQGQLYPSYRYELSDFLSALTKISEDGVDGAKFYVGDPSVAQGVRYGMVNAVMFLAQAYKESIQYDACDENNWQMVNDRYPLSNSCGQLGMSYQDMHCPDDEAFAECPVKLDMEQYALTSALWFQAPGPFKCGPKSKFPITGYWDYELGKENNRDAYANDRGRVDVEGCCWWGRGIIQTRGVCNYGKLNYYIGARAAKEGRASLYPTIDFCEFPQGVCSSDETYGGELQWMVGLFEWVDRIQTYDNDGWNYIEQLIAFTDGGYSDFDFVDRVSAILNLGCHAPPCVGTSLTATEPHNKRERNDTFQRFLNQLEIVPSFPAPPPPTPLPTPFPTEEPTPVVPITTSPTKKQFPTFSPTISLAPTSLAGRPLKAVANVFLENISRSKARFEEVLLMSEHPYGVYPSYLYTWRSFIIALKKMIDDDVGPGPGNWFYIGDAETVEYGLVNLAAFLAHGITQSIYYDACDENNWELVNFRYPLSNSCGQGLEGGPSYQDQICTDEDEGIECDVDEKMEINGVTHAEWIGAPAALFCGDKSTGYWDHVTGFERNEKPFKNAAGRSDVRGCCWWGRGVLQVRGVCQYGKLNYYLGAGAAAERRESLYPNIDFCRNPGAICSDGRAPELRWVTGLFYWSNQVQRSRGNVDYLGALRTYVDGGDFEQLSFINTVNSILGGNPSDVSNRTKVFFNALKVFGFLADDISDNQMVVPKSYCGTDLEDAGRRCSILCGDLMTESSCPEGETCFAKVESCNSLVSPNIGVGNDLPVNATDAKQMSEIATAVATEDIGDSSSKGAATDSQVPMYVILTTPVTMMTSTLPSTVQSSISTDNYCGVTWTAATTHCNLKCPSGTDIECPPGQFCFAQIATCTSGSDATNNWCGEDWADASSRCFKSCPAGLDGECPPPSRCFGDVTSC